MKKLVYSLTNPVAASTPSLNIQSGETPSCPYGTFDNTGPISGFASLPRQPVSLPPAPTEETKPMGFVRSNTLPSKGSADSGKRTAICLFEAMKIGDPIELMADTPFYESLNSDEGSLDEIGPSVGETIDEIEELSSGALDEIRKLTEQREALDSAPLLETCLPTSMSNYLATNCQLTLEILNLRTRYLSIKFAFLSGMLEKLVQLEKDSITPSYLRLRTFNDWMTHSSIVFDIQDKMLRARTRKVATKRKFLAVHNLDQYQDLTTSTSLAEWTDIVRLKSISEKLQQRSELVLMKSDIDNIHRQLSQILREDNSQRDLLDRILSDPRSFERRKIEEYIRECVECAARQLDPDHEQWQSILVFENNMADAYSESIPGANPSRYQEYVKAMTQYIYDKLKFANVPVDQRTVFAALEQKIVPRIYREALDTVTKEVEDRETWDKCRRLRGYTQGQIGIPEEFISDSPLPFISIISRLKSLVLSTTPTKIMRAICFAAEDIHRYLTTQSANGGAMGADAFLPIWVFCIIRANIPNLATLVNFLKGYLNPELRYCEIGYYVTCLEGACVYIQSLKEVDYNGGKQYFVFDRRKYRDEIPTENLFLYLGDMVLSGYRLYINAENTTKVEYFEEMMSDGVMQMAEVGEEGTKSVCLDLPNHNPVPPESEEAGGTPIRSYLAQLKDSAIALLHAEVEEETPPVAAENNYPWLYLQQGDLDLVRPLMELVVSLSRIGIWDENEGREMLQKVAAGTLTSLPKSALSRIALKFGYYPKTEDSVRRFLAEIQLLLRHLNFLSRYCEIDGVISEAVVLAVQDFQKLQNSAGGYLERLREDGKLCKVTYGRLRATLRKYLAGLKELELVPSFSPLAVENSEMLTQFISNAQRSLGIGRKIFII
eukprot:sb/3461908/